MKKLMLSTAIVAATSVPVFAQEADGMFRQEASPTELHASEFIGMRVYRTDEVDAEAYEGVQENWDDIGEINDVVFSRDGNVEAVLVDIGGFLGIGENQVAVDMDSIRFVSDSATTDEETDFFLVLNAPRGALEEAPTYGMMGGQDRASDADSMSAETSDMSEQSDTETADAGTNMEQSDEQTAAGDMTATEGDSDTEMAATTGETSETPSTPSTDAGEGQAMSDTGMSREGYVTASGSELIADDLTGAAAYDRNDERVGEVSELLLAEDGKIEAAIVDVGGFLGIGEKPVELELSKLDILRAEDGSDLRVYISMTEEELEALPEFER